MGNLAELLNRDAEIGDADAAARATQGADTEDVAEPIAIQKVSSDTREKARGKALDQAQGTPGEDVIDPIEPEITQELPQVEGSPTERAARVALQGSPGPIEMQAPPRALPSDMGARGITAPEMTVGQQRVAADNERIQLESSPDFQNVMGIMGGDQQATSDRLYAAAVYQAERYDTSIAEEYINTLNKMKIALDTPVTGRTASKVLSKMGGTTYRQFHRQPGEAQFVTSEQQRFLPPSMWDTIRKAARGLILTPEEQQTLAQAATAQEGQ